MTLKRRRESDQEEEGNIAYPLKKQHKRAIQEKKLIF